MPNTVPAAAEGLPSVTRRNALSITGAGIAATLAGLATSPAAATEIVGPGTRLANAIKEMEAALEAWGGQQFGIRVYPTSIMAPGEHSHLFDIEYHRGYALAAGLAYNRQQLDETITPELAALIAKHRKAWTAMEAHPSYDKPFAGLSDSEKRLQLRQFKRNDSLMRALVAFRCQTTADRKAKAAYLAAHEDTRELIETDGSILPVLIRSFA